MGELKVVDAEELDNDVEDDDAVMRQCTRCDRLLALAENFSKHKTRKDGYQAWCKECFTEYQQINAGALRRNNRKWKQENPEKVQADHARRNPLRTPEYIRESNLRAKYGLTVEAWNDMLKNQNDLCAFCHEPFDESKGYRDKHTDHDHTTGTVRGIIHGQCNRLIGVYEQIKPRLNEFEAWTKGKTA